MSNFQDDMMRALLILGPSNEDDSESHRIPSRPHPTFAANPLRASEFLT